MHTLTYVPILMDIITTISMDGKCFLLAMGTKDGLNVAHCIARGGLLFFSIHYGEIQAFAFYQVPLGTPEAAREIASSVLD